MRRVARNKRLSERLSERTSVRMSGSLLRPNFIKFRITVEKRTIADPAADLTHRTEM